LIDEAYIQFADPAADISGLSLVRAGKNVVVTRTFSKLYGMAGVRIGFACAPAALIQKMQPFRNNVISILGARAAMAAVELGEPFVAERRARRNRIRDQFRAWLDRRGLEYIPPHANFVLIHLGRDVRNAIPKFLAEGVATGRRFEAMSSWLRVAIGTESEMAKFQAVFEKIVG
jgi:histidinol-phosphate/aromatic aminotransferase/cobyric acid decarboxylase-like protein